MASNVGLCVVKGVVGVYSGSSSLIADAAHSISDTVSDVVTLATVKLSRKPADSRQPYGYGRFETLGTLGVSGLLMAAGGACAYHVVDILVPVLSGDPFPTVTMVPAALSCAVLSVLIKEWLYQVTVRAGRAARSQVVVANAWHHRTDAFSSIVTIFGVGGAAMGAPILDPLGGILVSGMIMKMGAEIGWQAIHNLVDAQTDEHILATVRDVGESLARQGHIKNIHNVRCRRLGHYVLVDLHVMVDEFMSVTAGHQAGQRVEHEIKNQLPEVSECMIQIDAEVHHHDTAAAGSAMSSLSGNAEAGDDGIGLASVAITTDARAVSGEGSGSPTSTLSHRGPTMQRTHLEIEGDIRRVVAGMQLSRGGKGADGNGRTPAAAIQEVSHCSVHYVGPKGGASDDTSSGNSISASRGVIAEVSLILDPGITVAAAKMAGLAVRDEVMAQLSDVHEVDVHMELLHGVLDRETFQGSQATNL